MGLVEAAAVQYSFCSYRRCGTQMKVPLLDLKSEYAELRDEILPALDRICQESAFVQGPEVEAFEKEFAAFCGTKHCVALSSGCLLYTSVPRALPRRLKLSPSLSAPAVQQLSISRPLRSPQKQWRGRPGQRRWHEGK